jgi:hypothetical protein
LKKETDLKNFNNMKTLLFFVAIIFFGCKSENQNTKIDELKPEIKINEIGTKYFNFDEIDYYYNDYKDLIKENSNDILQKSDLELLKNDVLFNSVPQNISDSAFINKLETIDFIKKTIEKTKYKAIEKIFTFKTVKNLEYGGCIYIYRDILVFKKNRKVIGVAKICFGCNDNKIIGTNVNTENFGQDGDYEKLSKLLP